MANMLFTNNANTTLASSLTNVATTMSVTSASAFPSPTGSQYFYCTLADAATQTTIEIVKVTAVSGTTFTIIRGQDGTSGTAFASGAVVSLRLVSASLNDFPKLDEANTFTFAPIFNTALGVASGGTGITTIPTNGNIPIGNGTNYVASTITAGTNIAVTNGSGSVSIATSIPTPQVTVYASGSGTYTTPANAKYIVVEMVGGGGGGAGSGASPAGSPAIGGTGGTTTFGTSFLSCAGGGGGIYGGSGTGGAPTGGGTNGVSINGGDGNIPGWTQLAAYVAGGNGGSSALGGAGAGSWIGNNGVTGKANTGGGGGGAGTSAVATYPNSGGGAGAYIRTIITSPSATYSYAVGAGGTAGSASTNGYAGGAGSAGLIIVTAYF